MANIHLIGSIHSTSFDEDGDQTIMNTDCDAIFFGTYGNYVNENTLIISEGRMEKQIIKPNDQRNNQLLKKVSPLLAADGKNPHLLFPDLHYLLPNSEQLGQIHCIAFFQKILEKNLQKIEFVQPSSSTEILDLVRNNTCQFRIKEEIPFPSSERAIEEFLAAEEMIDIVFAQQTESNKDNYQNIFIVLSDIRMLCVAKTLHYPITIIGKGNEFERMRSAYIGYLALRELPKAMIH